ncbi:16S rRNA (uracil(1498)-N(3))-methyltransferase [Mycoplasma corogypsi]|uniref:16S rRNA (uracil(1498)-N(3))-methyltransferase n=1 Tax=Mycoplasma corogypsi TaxID=2106 RepID=UPI0038736D3F
MNRFFVEQKQDNYFLLNKETLKHLQVIRIADKPFICVYQKEFYKCILENEKALIIDKLDENHEFNFEVILALSVIKIERFEWALQKATELGATKIIPVVSQFTNGELIKYGKFDKKIARFNEIIKNAAEQSFRNIIPTLLPLTNFNDLVKNATLPLVLAHEKTNTIDTSWQNKSCILLVGPEGGFSDEEVALATQRNAKIISLGKRILRAETAALYLLSQIKET